MTEGGEGEIRGGEAGENAAGAGGHDDGAQSDEIYLDWNGATEILQKAFDAGLFVLVIGPKGTGKTTLVRSFARRISAPLSSLNFSLRTRESHLIGTVGFGEGILVKSMRQGGILYLDEINAAEADVLLRLDEALDDRRQIVLKESDNAGTVRASPGWFVVATINPLGHAGTKELPPQLLSRFPVRIKMGYPTPDIEASIVSRHAPGCPGAEIGRAISLANTLRRAADVEELYYSPSLRETIAFATLVGKGTHPSEAAVLVFGNVYAQWGDIEYEKVGGIIHSMFGAPPLPGRPSGGGGGGGGGPAAVERG